jgi:hypothetical protein
VWSLGQAPSNRLRVLDASQGYRNICLFYIQRNCLGSTGVTGAEPTRLVAASAYLESLRIDDAEYGCRRWFHSAQFHTSVGLLVAARSRQLLFCTLQPDALQSRTWSSMFAAVCASRKVRTAPRPHPECACFVSLSVCDKTDDQLPAITRSRTHET